MSSPPAPPGPGREDTTKLLGVSSLVCGIVAIPAACCCWFIGWIPALVALGTGIVGLVQLPERPSADPNTRTFLVVGVVLGGMAMLIGLLSLVTTVISPLLGYVMRGA